jgi:hypothetical protein
MVKTKDCKRGRPKGDLFDLELIADNKTFFRVHSSLLQQQGNWRIWCCASWFVQSL